MPQPQTFKNHARFRPLFHYTILPILLLNLLLSIGYAVHYHYKHAHFSILWVILSAALIFISGDARNSALQAQDRIIRLEERLRLTALGVPHATTHALTERQLIALRFASDAELPALAERAVREKLTEKQIKASIQSWRPDYFRV